MKKYAISEIFASFQGEGRFTGMPSLWVRFFGCNLECNGFGQDFPTDPKTYDLPYKKIDITNISSLKELPVFSYGCDSSYSWSAKFKHLIQKMTVTEIINRLYVLGKEDLGLELYNKGVWSHPISNVNMQLCFTGGEPMLQQKAMNEICAKLNDDNSRPYQITIETNATKPLKEIDVKHHTNHLHLSCSPKLYSVSGEKHVIDFTIIKSYIDYADSGCLKFVHNGTKEAWIEMDWIAKELSHIIKDTNWDIWIMPVGSTIEEQETKNISSIVLESLKRGYSISLRNHVYAFGNEIGR